MVDVYPTDVYAVKYYKTTNEPLTFDYSWRITKNELQELLNYMSINKYQEVEITKNDTIFFMIADKKENQTKLNFTPGIFKKSYQN